MDNLGQTISDAFNGTNFNLDIATLDSDAANDIARLNFPLSMLNLTEACYATTQGDCWPVGTDWPSSYENPLVVKGTGVDLPFRGLEVLIAFYLNPQNNEQGAFELRATADNGWTLTDGFPPFGNSLVDSLLFASPYPQLSLNTAVNDTNISFTGSLSVSAMTGGLSTLLGIDTLPMQGSISLVEEGGGLEAMNIVSAVQPVFNFGTILNATGEIELSFDKGQDPDNNFEETAKPYLRLSTEIAFEAGVNEYTLPISVKVTNLASKMRFEADINQLIQASIDQINYIMGNADLGALIPTDFQLDQYLIISELFLDYNPNTYTVPSMGITVANTSPWNMFTLQETGQSMSVDQVILEFQVNNPLSNLDASFTWSGTIDFFAFGTFVIQGGNPISYTAGYLETNTDFDNDNPLDANVAGVDIKEVVELFLGASYGMPSIQIDEFRYDCDLSTGFYELKLEAIEDWDLSPLPLFLDSVSLEITYDPEENGLSGSIAAEIVLIGANIQLEAEYPGNDGAWIFTGATEDGASLNVLDLIQQIETLFGVQDDLMPDFLTEMSITNLGTTFNTQTLDFTFHAELDLTAWQTDIIMTVDIQVEKQSDGTYRKAFAGHLDVAGVIFDLNFSTDPSVSAFVAVLSDLETWETDLSILVGAMFGGDADDNPIPEGLTFMLKDAVFGMLIEASEDGVQAQPKFVFGLDIGNNINLSNLPLVGRYFSPDQTVALAYQLLVAYGDFSSAEVAAFNRIIPPNTITFPQSTDDGSTSPIPSGFVVSISMRMGDQQQVISLPVTLNTTGDIVPTGNGEGLQQRDVETESVIDPLYWNLQKNFGPVYLGRIGVVYEAEDNRLKFLIDASLSAAGLSLSVDGLSVSSPLTADAPYTDLIPTFGLKGMGVSFVEGPLTLGGAFLHQTKELNGVTFDEYSGAVTIQFEEFGFSAIGSYANYQDTPSLFIYMMLGVPIPIQPYLIITGVSGGFGYNRSLIVPPMDDILNFPLVSEVLGNSESSDDPLEELEKLDDYVPPHIGEYWIAAGIRFSSFKLIDCFALLMISLGDGLEIDIFGSASVMAPPLAGEEALAEIQMVLDVSYRSVDNRIAVVAELTDNSFILSRKAKLTGGVAMNAWLGGENAGDFVLTAGGYHPEFIVPAHYPTIPRIGLNWKYDESLTIKGELYYALLANMMMAGGQLEVSWKSGDLAAWFVVNTDLLMGWKPFFYDAKSKVSVGASYTFDKFGIKKTLSYEVGANLHLFGPEFSGTLHIDLSVISFDIAFGATQPVEKVPIDWNAFKSSFLPDIWIVSSPVSGLVSKTEDDWYTINPGDFCVDIASVIPLNSIELDDTGDYKPISFDNNVDFGIAPMDISSFSSQLKITMLADGQPISVFDLETTSQKIPMALWGTTMPDKPDVNGDLFIENTATGLRITPSSAAIIPDTMQNIPTSKLSFETTVGAAELDLTQTLEVIEEDVTDSQTLIEETITSPEVMEARTAVLAVAGISPLLNVSEQITSQFLNPPVVIDGFQTTSA